MPQRFPQSFVTFSEYMSFYYVLNHLPVELRKTRVMAQSILPKVQPAEPKTRHLQIDYPDLLLPN